MLTQSAVITGASATATIDINITGINNLRLVVTDNGDGNGYDHADWADAKLTCDGTADTTPPTVVSSDTARTARQESASPRARRPGLRTTERGDSVRVDSQLTTSPGGVAVAGTVTYDNTARSITFTPSAALTANSSYQLQIIGGASGIADLAGNHLTTVTTTFTTASADTTPPTVTNVDAAQTQPQASASPRHRSLSCPNR